MLTFAPAMCFMRSCAKSILQHIWQEPEDRWQTSDWKVKTQLFPDFGQ